MKVYELIETLKQCDIGKEVFIFKDANIMELDYIDEMSDRVDINIKGTEAEDD